MSPNPSDDARCSTCISKYPVVGHCPQLKTPWGNPGRKDNGRERLDRNWRVLSSGNPEPVKR